MDVLLSVDVDVSASVFVEDDADVPSKVVVILFVAVDVTTGVVSFSEVELVFVSGVSVDMVCAVVVVCVAASVAFEFTVEFKSVVVAPSVVDSDTFDTSGTVVDAFDDISLEVVILIGELSPVVVVVPATVELVGGSLVLAVEFTISVVELSIVLFSVLSTFVDAAVVVGAGGGEVRESVVDDAENCTFQIIKTINIYVDRICVTET